MIQTNGYELNLPPILRLPLKRKQQALSVGLFKRRVMNEAVEETLALERQESAFAQALDSRLRRRTLLTYVSPLNQLSTSASRLLSSSREPIAARVKRLPSNRLALTLTRLLRPKSGLR